MKYGIAKTFPLSARITLPRIPLFLNRLFHTSDSTAYRCLYERSDVRFTQYFIPYAEWSTQKAEGFDELEVDVIEPRDSLTGTSSPCGEGKRPVLFYIHGGAFLKDASRYHYEMAARYAREAGVVVVMPRYRHTTGTMNPAQVSDCRLAWKWMIDHAENLTLDADHAGVAGEGSGAFLAIQHILWAVESGFSPSYQLLVCPVVDPFMRFASMKRYTHTPVWNSRLTRHMWHRFFGDYKCLHTSARLSASVLDRVTLPEGMPPAWIETAEFDCFHDEGVAYAEKLAGDNVPVLLEETRGTMFGYDRFAIPLTEQTLRARLDFLSSYTGKGRRNWTDASLLFAQN